MPAEPRRPPARSRALRRLALLGACLLAGLLAGLPLPATAAQPAMAQPAAAQPAVARTELAFPTGETGKQWQFGGAGYEVGVDAQETRTAGGPRSLRLAWRPGAAVVPERTFGVATTRFPVEAARGKHLRLEGWVRTDAITRGWAALWARVDGPNGVLAFDNMMDRGIHGTTSWSPVEVEMDVPPDASAIFLGALLTGDGTAWVSELAVVVEPIRPAEPVTVAGQVTDPAGRPVAGALVAMIPANASRAAAVVKSGSDGTFRASLAKGRYAMTATAAGLAAAFAPPIAVHEPAPPVKLVLGADCVNLIGTVTGAEGPPPAGTRVEVGRFSNENGDAFYGELDGAGRFRLCLSPARYEVALDAADLIAKPVGVDIAKGGPDRQVTLHASRLGPPPDEVVGWLRGHAVPLRTAAAGQGYDDLRPLAAIVGKARIVALGEATHGTREFFQLKHRVLEYLVSEQGFTVFAIEANWPESLAVDDYVLHGTGDPAKAQAGLYFWTWNTEEVLDMIRWMRAYNAAPAHPRKVRFLGFDMQTAKVASPVVGAYLEKVDPAYAKETAGTLAALRQTSMDAPPAASAAALSSARALLARFDSRRDAYVAASSQREWDLARQHAVIVAQAAELGAVKQADYRDRAMAENVGWILAHEPAGTRMVVWAHNGHVNYGTGTGYTPMGENLRRAFGADYLNIGFVFNQGAFQAIGGGAQGPKALAEFSLGPCPESDLAAAFSRTGMPLALLDLRGRPTAGPVAAWLTSPHPMRETGALFASEAEMTEPVVITDRFDAVLFVDHTTRARPNRAAGAAPARGGAGPGSP
ncbi:MAG TPA: erythromycin esterase family protein [Thermoanaerobaculia bacterium]|nr:erythromycin esterase family protein [Thermoanaerobaculia bacterium]